jgi:hypothetical protein
MDEELRKCASEVIVVFKKHRLHPEEIQEVLGFLLLANERTKAKYSIRDDG